MISAGHATHDADQHQEPRPPAQPSPDPCPRPQGELEVREMLIGELRADIVGPRGGPEERLPSSESPLRGYISGVLFPQRSPSDDDADNAGAGTWAGSVGGDDGDDGSPDTGDNSVVDAGGTASTAANLSSFGLTCTVLQGTKKITATVDYGTYVDTGANDAGDEGRSVAAREFRRMPHSERLEVVVDGGSGSIPLSDRPEFVLRYAAGPDRGGRGTTLRVFMVNTLVHRDAHMPAVSACVFQPRITLSAHDGTSRVFVGGRPAARDAGVPDPDLALFEMLFRDKAHVATGHCCAVEWDEAEASAHGAVRSLATTFVPRYDMQHIGPRKSTAAYLDMEALAGAGMREYKGMLSPLADEYEAWIRDKLESGAASLQPDHRDAAARQVAECRSALRRIRAGIHIVSTDEHAAAAFAFANGAMRLQMLHSQWAEQTQKTGKVEGYEPPPPKRPFRWHLFQLAFFLLNIESIVKPESPDRSIADLLWFPTGGGKTEAYLGLIAFTMAHRRIRRSGPGHRYGTAVIMRYTLRLLTLQQFHRAAALMCACEVLRREDEDHRWGDEPFLVGLWVGYATTPNTLKAAELALKRARGGSSPREQNPVQIIACPWCGTRITARDYSISGMPYRCRVFCPRPSCDFSRGHGRTESGIPVLVVDEDIYRSCPPLVIGTVDKFAQVTWKRQAGALFGIVDKYCEKHGFTVSALDSNECGMHRDARSFLLEKCGQSNLDPPELIIQDELHLISGPLGTLTGIYETAVDALCTNSAGIAPKIIASTATAKQASAHMRSLFDRTESRVFPPQGFEFGESFFARKVPPSEMLDKAYVGVCVTSRSGLAVLGRISASVLRKVRSLEERSLALQSSAGDESAEPPLPTPGDRVDASALSYIDPYHTLVSYFNTIRELGGANKMYDDTVPRLIQRIYSNFERAAGTDSGVDGSGGASQRRPSDYKDEPLKKKELTSRIDSADIPTTLGELEARIDGGSGPRGAVDLLLCTNMLSVGVDIRRLGTMIVNGQPKNHSEYIQATGRIGRASPGLIITNLNFFKPRDLSHYEDFFHYHSILHKNVEPIAVTPFSPRSRDRALLGVLVAMVRHADRRLAPDKGAGRFDAGVGYVKDILDRVRSAVASRVGRIDASEADGTMSDLDEHIRFWHDAATGESGGGLGLEYSKPRNPKARRKESVDYLLRSTGEDDSLGLREAPNSLRDAEVPVRVWYASDMSIDYGGGGGEAGR